MLDLQVNFANLVQQLATILRPYDSLGRFGGEEFLIVVPGSGAAQTKELSERIRAHIAENPVALSGASTSITVSAGVAAYKPGSKLESLLHLADTALYSAKRTGRNCVELALEPPEETVKPIPEHILAVV